MAASPGKVDGEAAEEVEEGPGQDNDVVDVQEDDNHLGSISDACRAKLQNWARDRGQSSHTPPIPVQEGFALHCQSPRQHWAQAPGSLLCLPGR